MRMGDCARFCALAGGCVVLASLALTARGSAASATSVLPGCTGHDPAGGPAESAMGSFGSGVHATVKPAGDWPAAGVGARTLACRRGAREPSASVLPVDAT